MTSVLVNLARVAATILVVVLLAAATVELFHHVTASGSDAWATAVEAVATVVLRGDHRVVRIPDLSADPRAADGPSARESSGGGATRAQPANGPAQPVDLDRSLTSSQSTPASAPQW